MDGLSETQHRQGLPNGVGIERRATAWLAQAPARARANAFEQTPSRRALATTVCDRCSSIGRALGAESHAASRNSHRPQPVAEGRAAEIEPRLKRRLIK